jgi:ribosome biogenesis GTPase
VFLAARRRRSRRRADPRRNVDTVFLVTGLDQNYSPRRIERYLAVARASGGPAGRTPQQIGPARRSRRRRNRDLGTGSGVPVVALSAARGDGIDALADWLVPGSTVALLALQASASRR